GVRVRRWSADANGVWTGLDHRRLIGKLTSAGVVPLLRIGEAVAIELDRARCRSRWQIDCVDRGAFGENLWPELRWFAAASADDESCRSADQLIIRRHLPERQLFLHQLP